MTLIWFVYGMIDEFKPIEKQELMGEMANGYCIAILPCLLIDCIIISILNYLKII